LPKSILVTGVAGSGKSTVCKELQRRGYKAFDIELMRPLFAMKDRITGRTVSIWDNTDLELVKRLDWLCDGKKLGKLVRRNRRGVVFYCGIASNLDGLVPLFDKVLLLRCSREVLGKRLRARTTNDFGSDPKVRRWLLDSKTKWEGDILEHGAVAIDADGNLAETTDGVVEEAQRA
jgi:broad-specificity NMP kinase